MNKRSTPENSFRAGMYLLETLTAGMYNDPLAIYREYIQNAVDSIDLVSQESNVHPLNDPLEISIAIDPHKRCVLIRDSGMGISNDTAAKVLASVGISDKTGRGLRGFRGIGRLGGIAFCDRAVFRTKSKGEKVESVQEWNCRKLRGLLSDSSPNDPTLRSVFKKITKFYQQNSKQARGSYFEVVLEGVSSFRNYIMDYQKVRNYLEQVAPVPLDPNTFTLASELRAFLTSKIKNYREYNIALNGTPIFKPYRDTVKITSKRGPDVIRCLQNFHVVDGGVSLGWGWYGDRRDLLGAISRGESVAGIRVRAGNIMIGDPHLLDGIFREPRFNSYLIGEIHVDHPGLIPNSRRDDFVDNEAKTLFYNAVEKQIGLPLSKEIRLRSRMSSIEPGSRPFTNPKGPKSEINIMPSTENSLQHAPASLKRDGSAIAKVIRAALKSKCKGCNKLPRLLSLISSQTTASSRRPH